MSFILYREHRVMAWSVPIYSGDDLNMLYSEIDQLIRKNLKLLQERSFLLSHGPSQTLNEYFMCFIWGPDLEASLVEEVYRLAKDHYAIPLQIKEIELLASYFYNSQQVIIKPRLFYGLSRPN